MRCGRGSEPNRRTRDVEPPGVEPVPDQVGGEKRVPCGVRVEYLDHFRIDDVRVDLVENVAAHRPDELRQRGAAKPTEFDAHRRRAGQIGERRAQLGRGRFVGLPRARDHQDPRI